MLLHNNNYIVEAHIFTTQKHYINFDVKGNYADYQCCETKQLISYNDIFLYDT